MEMKAVLLWLGTGNNKRAVTVCDGRASASPLLLYLKKKFGNKVENVTEWACYANTSQFAELTRDSL